MTTSGMHWPVAGERLKAGRLAVSALVFSVAAAVLAGWFFDVGLLKSVLPGLTTMKANTAIGLAAGAAAVALLEGHKPTRVRFAIAAAILMASIGLLTLIEYGLGIRLGIDEFLFADPATTSAPFRGRMSPATALGFLAAGTSLALLAAVRARRAVFTAHILALIPASCGFVSLAGYAYGVEQLYSFGPFVSVALHTGVALVLLSLATVLIRHREGWANPFIGNPIASAALLRIGLLAILVPFASGLLVVWGIRAGLYQALFAPTLFALAAAGALLQLAFQSARILARAEHEVRLARVEAGHRSVELAQTRVRHEALLEGLPQLVWTCLPDGSCNYLSRQWLDYTGIPEAEQLGDGWLAVIDPRDADRTRIHWLGAVAGNHPYDIEYRIRGADGAYRWFKTRGVHIVDPTDGGSYWFGTCTDIEDIVAARELLAESRQELLDRVSMQTADLMAAEEKLRQSQKMEAVGQLTGGLAHDFNNLLTGIMGSLELLQKRISQGRLASAERYITTAQEAATRAAALTHRLLAFSRRQTLDPKPTDANRLVAHIEDLIRRTVGPAISFEVATMQGIWPILIDPPQLENALLNLAINARDAMPGGGRLRITTANTWLQEGAARDRDLPTGQYVSICVSDTGTGMAPDVIARAFDPFFTTKPLGSGTGLGLSMVYGFVKQSGGQSRIYSELGQGTRVELYLPRHHGSVTTAESTLETTAIRAAEVGETVLIVDDETSVRTLVSETLEGLGYIAIEAVDGLGGLRVLQSDVRVDLLITDVGLPGGMNGRQVADAARVVRPGLQVLFITGYAEHAVIGNGALDTGMHVLTKPFAMEALARRIQDIVGPIQVLADVL